MKEPILIESLGDSVNLRILNFFIENPFDAFSVQQISRFAKISRNSVYKYLPEFEEKGYLIKGKNGTRDVFRLNRSNSVVRLIDGFVDDVGSIYLEPLRRKAAIRIPNEEPMVIGMAQSVMVSASSSG